jgi:hypothetical protein
MIIEWLEKGPLDLEYKQYKLLAYLKEVDRDWNKYILYPHLSNIVEYNSILTSIKKNKSDIEELFPKEATGIDIEKMEIVYETKPQTGTRITEDLQEIIDWGIDRLDEYSQIGIIIYEDIAEDIKLSNIGLDSIVKDEGYIIFFDDTIKIYKFHIGSILIDNDGGRYMMTNKVRECEREKFQTPEDIKLMLVKEMDDFAVPNFYCVEGFKPYPFEETVLPIVKRKILVNSRL